MNKFFIGCGAVLLIAALLVGVLILQTPRFLEAGKTAIKNVIAEEQRVSAFEAAWRAPSVRPDASWFPARVGEWRLEQQAVASSVPGLGLEREGQGGAYRSGRGLIEVNVVPVAADERAEVLAKAMGAIEARKDSTRVTSGGTFTWEAARFTTSRGNRTYVRVGGTEHTRFWWLNGFLFIFRAHGGADSEEFPEAFLQSVTNAPPPER